LRRVTNNGPDYASDFTTLVVLLKAYEDEGYTGNFGAREEATVVCFSCHHETPAREVPLESMRRTEGASDPDDMAVVAAIVCPHCGQKGTLVMHFGATATPEEDEVLRDLEDRREK
jgi:hypothetical protein